MKSRTLEQTADIFIKPVLFQPIIITLESGNLKH